MRLSLSALFNLALPSAPEPNRVAFLRAQPFAHRGLHGRGIIENTLSAFKEAVSVGHGIELDVQLAANGELMVFHDERLDRLSAETGFLAERTGLELSSIKLFGTDDTIPRLSEVLSLVAGRVPILIEIKTNSGNINHICLAVRRALEGYLGDAAIMSFDHRIPAWFYEHARRLPRGLVVSERAAVKLPDKLRAQAEVRLALHRAKPDFVAYDLRCLPSPIATGLRRRKLPVLAWTIRDAVQERAAFAAADEIIYERHGG
jgi:glycerophosphoryl diester phosphodiesterase